MDYIDIAFRVEKRFGLDRQLFLAKKKLPLTVGDLCDEIIAAVEMHNKQHPELLITHTTTDISRIVVEIVGDVCQCQVRSNTELRNILE